MHQPVDGEDLLHDRPHVEPARLLRSVPVALTRRHERARRDDETEHDPRQPGDGACCDCGAVNPAYAPPEKEPHRE